MEIGFLAQSRVLWLTGITVLTAASAFGAVLSLRPWVGRIVERQEAEFHQALVELFLFEVTVRQLTYVSVGGALLVGAFFTLVATHWDAGGLALTLAFTVGLVLGFWIPRGVIFVLQRRRRDKLNQQLVDGLVTLANGMRAGLNLVQSMRLIEQNAQPPISQEFGLMLREFEHGASVDEVLRRASVRIHLHHYQLLFAAMETARMRGGNLPETLDRLGESLREIMRLEEKVQSLTAQNRLSARMMGFMPLVVAGIYYMIEPTWVETLLYDQWGLLLLTIAAVLNLAGFFWIRQIVTFEI
ncbi:MAG TPA: type II secretion system F family protein [Phycisphaerae bacterium]|nr:type II secretion system F family protein [Phycisphaerae bacterium]